MEIDVIWVFSCHAFPVRLQDEIILNAYLEE
jgi:hypothetical protein